MTLKELGQSYYRESEKLNVRIKVLKARPDARDPSVSRRIAMLQSEARYLRSIGGELIRYRS